MASVEVAVMSQIVIEEKNGRVLAEYTSSGMRKLNKRGNLLATTLIAAP